jgi:hypothetical protein
MLRLIASVVAVFLVWEATDIVLHGMVLRKHYEDLAIGSTAEIPEGTARVFRKEMDMRLIALVVLAHAAVFVKIYAWLVSPKSILAGVLFGLLWGVGHGVGMGYGTYATMPIPQSMASMWCLGAIIQGILGGIVTALIVRRRDEPPP